MSTISMHGPAFDGSGKLVNREVPKGDVQAYRAAGYVEGSVAVADDEKRADGTPCETYTEADVKAQMPKGKRK